MINPKLPAVYYGGDYNPDQWPEEVWKEDMRLFKLAGINVITIPVFSWAKLQPSEDTYDFLWLDRVLDLAYENGIFACLATSTAAQPAWMSLKYPEILPVDINGVKRAHGRRLNFCPNSKIYRKYSVELAKRLAKRYKDHPALLLWHISNEYGSYGYCYCENCAKEFREWLKEKYGTVEEVNRRWNLSFWGHTVYSWEEIFPPSRINQIEGGGDYYNFQGMSLDYSRFMSDSILECCLGERNAIKAETPGILVTTNIAGNNKPIDWFKWAKYLDVASVDSYPSTKDPACKPAMLHDLIRGLKGGQPHMLMEQTPSEAVGQSHSNLKRPGVMRLLSYQAVAHGADTVMYFQLRRSRGACEKSHGAVISNTGHENTRVFRECKELGDELKSLGDKLLDSRIKSRVALMFDWENWWAVEYTLKFHVNMDYYKQVLKYYKALHDLNIPVDMVHPASDLSGYDIVIAPVLYIVKPGVASKLESFVEAGGTFVTTYYSGQVDENDLFALGGSPGELKKLLGLWSEETDYLSDNAQNSVILEENIDGLSGEYSCGEHCDLVNLEGARALAVYGKDFYKGRPALTENSFGKGRAYYIATVLEEGFLKGFMGYLCRSKGIKAPLEVKEGIEVTRRLKGGKEYIFVLNHNDCDTVVDLENGSYTELLTGKEVQGELKLEQKGVAILERTV